MFLVLTSKPVNDSTEVEEILIDVSLIATIKGNKEGCTVITHLGNQHRSTTPIETVVSALMSHDKIVR